MINKRKLFRWGIDVADTINIWFSDKFNLNPKRKKLEKKQDATSMKELNRTIGKALGIEWPWIGFGGGVITGHKTTQMINKYSIGVRQKRMAERVKNIWGK